MNTTTISKSSALQTALNYAGLAIKECHCVYNNLSEDLFEICVNTPYQRYEFYVEEKTGEVLGINAEPLFV